jgi:hypothetical protein
MLTLGRTATSGSGQSLPDTDSNILAPSMDRAQAQQDALNRLTGGPSSSIQSTAPTSTEPVSLASFMGGKATGPRLNKQMPQSDAHDPTKFNRPETTSPNPVFGRGGVAMPGMVKQPQPQSHTPAPSLLSRSYQVSLNAPSRDNERRKSTPSQSVRIPEIAEEQEPESQVRPLALRPRSKSRERERPFSTPPTGSTLQLAPTMSRPKSPGAPRYVPSPTLTQKDNQRSLPRNIPLKPAHSLISPAVTPPTSVRQPTYRYSTPPAPSHSPVALPGLARPALSTPPRASTAYSPPSTQSHAPPSAFLRAPAEKAATPSLSRLKGRGFVQSMVRTSTELEAMTSGSSPGSAEKTRPAVPAKKNILDRWPIAQPASPTPAAKSPPVRQIRHSMYGDVSRPTIPPASIQPMRTGTIPLSNGSGYGLMKKKSLPQIAVLEESTPVIQRKKSFHHSETPNPMEEEESHQSLRKKKSFPRSETPKGVEDQESRPSLNKKKSFSSESPSLDSVNAQAAPGLGSSNTLISYIKPMKTGDNPITSIKPMKTGDSPITSSASSSSSPPPATRSKTPVSRSKTPVSQPTAPITKTHVSMVSVSSHVSTQSYTSLSKVAVELAPSTPLSHVRVIPSY